MNSSKLVLVLLGLACLIQVGYSLTCYTCTTGCKSESELNQTTCAAGEVCQTQIYVVMSSKTWIGACANSSSATNSSGGTSIYGLGYTTKSYTCSTDLCNTFASSAMFSKSNVLVLIGSTLGVLLMLSL